MWQSGKVVSCVIAVAQLINSASSVQMVYTWQGTVCQGGKVIVCVFLVAQLIIAASTDTCIWN